MTAMTRREANPVLVKELRGRFRGPRAFAALTAYLMLLSGVALLAYATVVWDQPFGGYGSLNTASEAGRAIVTSVGVLNPILIVLIAPALAFGAIAGEVERKTFELLAATPLSNRNIVLGKLAAAMAFILLLVASVLPVVGLAFFFGGIDLLDVAQLITASLVLGFELVALGLVVSTLVRSTTRAAMLTYASTAALCLGPILLMWFGFVLLIGPMGPSGELGLHMLMLSPLPQALLLPLRIGTGGLPGSGYWLASVATHLLFGIAFVHVAVARVRPAHPARASRAMLPIMLGLAIWFISAALAPF